MAVNNDWKSKLGGLAYSTNPDLDLTPEPIDEPTTLSTRQQKLRAHFERAGRGGKTATIVTGFVGTESDLATLAKQLKTKLGIGGSVKDGEIILQGNISGRVVETLKALGYSQTK